MNKNDQIVYTRIVGIAITLPVAVMGLLTGATAAAQTDSNEVFEEIIVVSQRREQNILDVPIAVSTLSGTQLAEAGIKDVWDLQQNVPSLIMGRSQTSTTSNFNIRSIGSTSNNFGVESSVGLYVDGVYRSRQSSMINDLVDVEAIEVLRGPQGTLFGKNTAAGAVSVRTVRPSQDRDAFVDVTAGDYGLVKVAAAANVPVTDNVAIRGTIFSTQRDGIVDDTTLGKDVYNDRDRIGARLQLLYEPSNDFNMRIIADYAEIDETCCVGMPQVDSLMLKGALPALEADPTLILTGFGVGSDFLNGNLGGTVFTNFDYPQPLLDMINLALTASPTPGTIVAGGSWDDYRTSMNFPPESTNEDTGISVEFNWVLTDSVSMKSITAVRRFDTFDHADIDFSDVDLIERINTAEASTVSQEFQFNGEFGEGSTWVAGAYYFGQDLDSTTVTSAGLLFNAFAKLGNPLAQQTIDGVNALDAALEMAGVGGLLNPATEPFPAGTNAIDDVEQEHSGFAVFGQVDYAVSDKFTVSFGARFTDETKKINAVYQQTATNNQLPDLRPCAPVDPMNPLGDYAGGAICVALTEANIYFTDPFGIAFGGPFGSLDGVIAGDLAPVSEPNDAWGMYQFDPFAPRDDVREKLSDDQTTGTAKLIFFPADSTMLYASYSTGFKAGGTNADRINPAFDQIFQAETSKSVEVGLKGQYGRVQVAATVYQTDFEDFQANSFSGGGFNMQNAGDLTIEGVELEFLWRPTDSTEIQAWYAHNEGTFNSFEDGTAWDSWVRQIGVWQGEGDPGCADQPFDPNNLPDGCPRTGESLPYNPEDRAFVALTQDFDVGTSNTAFVRLEYSYASDQTTDGDNDPLTVQDGYGIFNARLGLNFGNSNSTLTLWGRNITDERYHYGSFDIPVSEDKMMSYPGEPATYGITYRMNFD